MSSHFRICDAASGAVAEFLLSARELECNRSGKRDRPQFVFPAASEQPIPALSADRFRTPDPRSHRCALAAQRPPQAVFAESARRELVSPSDRPRFVLPCVGPGDWLGTGLHWTRGWSYFSAIPTPKPTINFSSGR